MADAGRSFAAGIVTALSRVLMLACVSGSAGASFHTFQIDELYSSADGSIQFIELHEAFGVGGQQFLAGHSLTSAQGATTRSYTFPANLPDALTAGKRVLIATPAFAALGLVAPDFIVSGPFLFPGGGTINYAGVDSVTYPALPSDGVSSLGRSGATFKNSPTNYAGQTGSISAGPPAPAVIAAIPAVDLRVLALLGVLMVAVVTLRHRRR